MIIEQLEIQGFKSYKERTILKNFGDNFNAITGNNGSGKSNILDSICFVLGLSTPNLIRVSKIEQLIHSSGSLPLNEANITLTLKHSKFNNVPKKKIKFNERITISRKVFINGKNTYFFNGLKVSPTKILNFLFSLNLNINNPYFLVRQGHITNVVFMSDSDLLELVENSVGTKLYDIKKKLAMDVIVKKQEKLNYINNTLYRRIRPMILNFEIFLKRTIKNAFYQTKKDQYLEATNIDKLVDTFKKKIARKKRQMKICQSISTVSIQFAALFRFSKILKDKKYKKTKLSKLLNILRFKKFFFSNLKRLFTSYRCSLVFLEFELLKIRVEEKIIIRKKKIEKLYFEKFFLFAQVSYKKFFHFKIKKILKSESKKKNVFLNENLWIFLEYLLSNFFKSNFSSHKFYAAQKNRTRLTIILNNFSLIDTLQVNVRLSNRNFSKAFLTYQREKVFSYLKEDITNYSLCFNAFLKENTKKLWKKRKIFDGIFLNQIELKTSNLTCAYEQTFSKKINFVLVKNKFLTKKGATRFYRNSQNYCLFSNYQEFFFFEKNFSCEAFMVISLIGFTTILSKTINYYRKYYIIFQLEKLSEIISMTLSKKLPIVTLFGEIFYPKDKTVFCGSFCSKHNSIFEKNRINCYSLQWLRYGTILKKKCILRNFNSESFQYIQTHSSKLNGLPVKTEKNQTDNLFSFINKIFQNTKKNKSIIQKNFLLYKIKKFNLRISCLTDDSNKISKKKLSFKFLNCLHDKFYNYHLLSRTKKKIIRFEIFLFFCSSFEFFILYFSIKKAKGVIKKSNSFNQEFRKINEFLEYPLKYLKFFYHKKSRNLNKNKLIKFIYFLNQVSNLHSLNSKKYFKTLFNKIDKSFNKPDQLFDLKKFGKILLKYDNFLFKRIKIEKDQLSIKEIIFHLDKKKEVILSSALKKINNSLGIIFQSMISIYGAKISIIKKRKKWTGIRLKVFKNKNEKSTSELSGGQKSILALAFIFSLLIFKTAPFYIFDEVDAALDFCYTENMSQLIVKNFSFAQFIIVSLKKQIILNSQVIFEVKQSSGKSFVTRLERFSKK